MKKKTLDIARVSSSYQFPYIAVMTILCVFFLMMYVYYYKTFEESAAVQNQKLADEIRKVLSTDMLKGTAKVEIEEEGVRVTLQTAILFDLGSASLKGGALPSLTELGKSFKVLPADYKVVIEGHTDDSPVWYGGDYASNGELSLYRALSLSEYFMKQGDIPERFTALGYGEHKPLVPNDTPENRASNRRVEILIRKKNIDKIELEYLAA